MNQKVVVAAVIVVALLAVGGFLFLNKGQVPTSSNNANPISSIQDALMNSMSLKCDYTTPEGIKSEVFIKNGMVRANMTGASPEQNSSMMVKDKKIYTWNAQGGMMMAMPEISITPSAGQNATGGQGSPLEAMEQYKNYCKPASVDDSNFVLPAGVNFQEMSTMMPSGAQPSGTQNAPTGVSREQIEEMMKQYQNSQ